MIKINIINVLTVCTLMLVSLSIQAEGKFPPPFKAHYQLYSGGLPVGQGTRQLSYLENGHLKFESQSHTTGVLALFRDDKIFEQSIFSLKNGQVSPLVYIYDQKSSKKPKYLKVQFDWPNKVAHSTNKQENWEIPINNGILDKLVYQLVVMQNLAQGKKNLTYQFVDKDKAKVYTPKFLGKEQLETGMGTIDTLKYQRISSNKKRSTTLWCAPDLHYLPVRVDHDEKGYLISTVLQSVEGLGKFTRK